MATGAYTDVNDIFRDLDNLQTVKLQREAMEQLAGDLSGLTVLDMACGGGLYTRESVKWGARKAVGVDISQVMVDNARSQTQANDRIDFHVADCAQPLGLGQFDVVLAPWLLNYAANEKQLLDMWQNIFFCLKPSGRVIGICPNLDFLERDVFPEDSNFGLKMKVLGKIEGGGLKVESTLETSKPLPLVNYFFPRAVYEKCAYSAGMCTLEWRTLSDPHIPGIDWDSVLLQPPFKTFTAVRPSVVQES